LCKQRTEEINVLIATTPRDLVGSWSIDDEHTVIGFSARHMMISWVRGQFTSFKGFLEVPEDPSDTKVTLTIAAASIWTHVQDRDDHLRTNDFLDAPNHPELTFVSTAVEILGTDRANVRGDLTIRGVTKNIALDVQLEGVSGIDRTDAKVSFRATAVINRQDWGVSWNRALEIGGVLVGDEVSLDIQATFKKQ